MERFAMKVVEVTAPIKCSTEAFHGEYHEFESSMWRARRRNTDADQAGRFEQ
jgi:hypothetical protein